MIFFSLSFLYFVSFSLVSHNYSNNHIYLLCRKETRFPNRINRESTFCCIYFKQQTALIKGFNDNTNIANFSIISLLIMLILLIFFPFFKIALEFCWVDCIYHLCGIFHHSHDVLLLILFPSVVENNK